jgi:hypothetical protein
VFKLLKRPETSVIFYTFRRFVYLDIENIEGDLVERRVMKRVMKRIMGREA